MTSTTDSGTHVGHQTFSQDQIAARKRRVKETMRCPYCVERLAKWRLPDSPFNEWPSEFQYICFNDACSYFVGGWATLAAQAAFGSYRFMYDPPTNGCYSMPVISANMLRDGIVVSESPLQTE